MWMSIFTGLLVTGTIIGVIVGLMQVHGISMTSKAQFLLRFKEDYFTKESRTLMDQIDRNNLKFVIVDSVTYFKTKVSGTDTLLSAYDIDNFLLENFEDIGMFESKGMIDLDMVDDMFGWYIEECWENKDIAAYVSYERAQYGNIQYAYFEYIYNKCKNFDKTLADSTQVYRRKH